MPRPKKPVKDSFGKEMIHTTPSGDTFRVTNDKTNKKYYVYKKRTAVIGLDEAKLFLTNQTG